MRNMCRHAGGQIYEIEKTHSTRTQASKSIKNIYIKILSRVHDTQRIENTTEGTDTC
jgi:hypothetical protein